MKGRKDERAEDEDLMKPRRYMLNMTINMTEAQTGNEMKYHREFFMEFMQAEAEAQRYGLSQESLISGESNQKGAGNFVRNFQVNETDDAQNGAAKQGAGYSRNQRSFRNKP